MGAVRRGGRDARRAHAPAQYPDYRSEISLWEADALAAPTNPRLQATLGRLYRSAGDEQRGLSHVRNAIHLSRGTIAQRAYAYEMEWLAADMCRQLGRGDEAIAHYRASLAGAVSDEEKLAVGLELAQGLDVLERTAEAEAVYTELLALPSDHELLRLRYAQFLARHGRAAENP